MTIDPRDRSRRVLVFSDVTNEADDPFAIAHALLSPSLDVRGIVGTHYVVPGSMECSYREAVRLMNIMGLSDSIPVVRGASGPLSGLSQNDALSDGAKMLIEEARRDDVRPLYVLVLGALTEVAEALNADPGIASCFVLIWVGGAPYPNGGREANLTHDIEAARIVFSSTVDMEQIACSGYRELVVSTQWIEQSIAPLGELGRYLHDRVITFSRSNAQKSWIMPECWVLGDNSAIGVLLAGHWQAYEEHPAPSIGPDGRYLLGNGRAIKVCEHVNTRFILDDLVAKLARFARDQACVNGDRRASLGSSI